MPEYRHPVRDQGSRATRPLARVYQEGEDERNGGCNGDEHRLPLPPDRDGARNKWERRRGSRDRKGDDHENEDGENLLRRPGDAHGDTRPDDACSDRNERGDGRREPAPGERGDDLT